MDPTAFHSGHRRTRRHLVALVLLLSGLLSTVHSGADTRCRSFVLPGAVVLPDGWTRTGRQLQICRVHDDSDARPWYEASIDGVAYGVYLGRDVARDASRGAASFAAFAPYGVDGFKLTGFSTGSDSTRVDTFFGSRFRPVGSLDVSALDLAVDPRGVPTVMVYAEADPGFGPLAWAIEARQ